MNYEQIAEKLKPFASCDKTRKALLEIAVKDNIAYVSDGRIGFSAKLSEPHPDFVPENFPLEALKEILEGAKFSNKFGQILRDDYSIRAGSFARKITCRQNISDSLFDERYKEMVCPCCGNTIYWDNNDEEVVKQKEEREVVDAREITWSTKMKFYDGDDLIINFAFLYLVRRSFGDYIRFCVGRDNRDAKVLCMESKDGNVRGVLMPMRPCCYEHLHEECSIDVKLEDNSNVN